MNQFSQLTEKIPSELQNLEDLAESRKYFENEMDYVVQWLSNTENVINSELKISSLNNVQEMLKQVWQLYFLIAFLYAFLLYFLYELVIFNFIISVFRFN